MKRILFNLKLAAAFSLFGLVAFSQDPEPQESVTLQKAIDALDLPGISIQPEERIVDVDAKISLEHGSLELIACTEGTKEHEAIVLIEAAPVHVHIALLLIGAKNGTPAMQKPMDEEKTRWMHFPPSGAPINVSLVLNGPEGEVVERPISDFVKRIENDDPYMARSRSEEEASEADEEEEKFPDTFLFTGSHLLEDKDGKKQYLADGSGHVITISTFGDELLGLAYFQSRANGELIWEVDSTHLPPLDTKVKLRLRLAEEE